MHAGRHQHDGAANQAEGRLCVRIRDHADADIDTRDDQGADSDGLAAVDALDQHAGAEYFRQRQRPGKAVTVGTTTAKITLYNRGMQAHASMQNDNVDVTTLAGTVTSINGFVLGPPNDSNGTMDWFGTCVDTKTTTHYNDVMAQVGDVISISSACRVALQARIWACCPAGGAP